MQGEDLMPDEETLPQGFEWSYWMCKKHENVARRMYQPYSASNPIIGAMPSCACSAHPNDGMVFEIAKESYDLRMAMKKMTPAREFAQRLGEGIDAIAEVEMVKGNDGSAILLVQVAATTEHPVSTKFAIEIRRIPR